MFKIFSGVQPLKHYKVPFKKYVLPVKILRIKSVKPYFDQIKKTRKWMYKISKKSKKVLKKYFAPEKSRTRANNQNQTTRLQRSIKICIIYPSFFSNIMLFCGVIDFHKITSDAL